MLQIATCIIIRQKIITNRYHANIVNDRLLSDIHNVNLILCKENSSISSLDFIKSQERVIPNKLIFHITQVIFND